MIEIYSICSTGARGYIFNLFVARVYTIIVDGNRPYLHTSQTGQSI